MQKIMKNILIIICMLIVSTITVNAKDQDVSITKINCSNMDGGELNENLGVKVNGLNIDVEDSYFSKVGDYTKCTLEITNDSKEEIKMDSSSISNLSDDYITYELVHKDSDIIKVGKSASYELNIIYKKEYEEEKEINQVMQINLSGDSNITNPNTASTILILIGIILIVLIITLTVYKNKKLSSLIGLLILSGILVIPSAQALTSITIQLQNKIIIGKEKHHIYNIMNGLTIAENEMNSYDLSKASCRQEFRVIENDPTNTKYYVCTGQIIKDLGTYHTNTQVELSSYKNNYLYGCQRQENQIVCKGIEKGEVTYWSYGTEYNSEYQENDKETMNFTNGLADDLWKEKGYFIFVVPNTFTMPNHDIYFYLQIMPA